MPKRIQPLSELQVKNAKPKDRDYKLADGGGLYLLVTPTGGKLWRCDYRYDDKRRTLAFGPYPSLTLAEARQRRVGVAPLAFGGRPTRFFVPDMVPIAAARGRLPSSMRWRGHALVRTGERRAAPG